MPLPPSFHDLGLTPERIAAGDLASHSPIDGSLLGRVHSHTESDVHQALVNAQTAFKDLRQIPAPVRGEVIRGFGMQLRNHKASLANLVTLECGKIRSEALGEVQEMIDICDFAVGLSRQLYGLTIASERPGHRLMEVWHPLGPVGVISAFNFPVAVWAWNSTLAIVCGNPVLWKPSDRTPLTALACQLLLERALAECPELPAHLSQVVFGGATVGQQLAEAPSIALLSATGSCHMGREVAPTVAKRMGRCLLELGGNNAMVIAPSADLALAIPAALFSAVGTAGQRCTSLRRLIVHRECFDQVAEQLRNGYESLVVGDPREGGTLVGPLIDGAAADAMRATIARAQAEGGTLLTGGDPVPQAGLSGGHYRRPALIAMPSQTATVHQETFAPILYLLAYDKLEEAIELNNAVEQGLSSSIFTTDLREAEQFLSAAGSDCGIANVNVGPSGAEIGGAFGGEKATGGGRESGSDAWRNYMRRATNTINYSNALPLAQGVRFDLNHR